MSTPLSSRKPIKVDVRPPYRILFAQNGYRRARPLFQWLLGFPEGGYAPVTGQFIWFCTGE
jgi:hypothetical protein